MAEILLFTVIGIFCVYGWLVYILRDNNNEIKRNNDELTQERKKKAS